MKIVTLQLTKRELDLLKLTMRTHTDHSSQHDGPSKSTAFMDLEAKVVSALLLAEQAGQD